MFRCGCFFYCHTAEAGCWNVGHSREKPAQGTKFKLHKAGPSLLLQPGRKKKKKKTHRLPYRLNSSPSAIVCTGGRSAVGGHALLRRAPGPEAPSAAQREGQRSALAAPLASARQTCSPALHGRRRHCGHRARLPWLAAHRCVSTCIFGRFMMVYMLMMGNSSVYWFAQAGLLMRQPAIYYACVGI